MIQVVRRSIVDVYNQYNFTRQSLAYDSKGRLYHLHNARFEAGKFDQAVMVEEGTTNLLSATDSQGFTSPVNVTVTSDKVYTVSMTGTGSIDLSGAGTGTVTASTPVTFTASGTTLTLTPTGSTGRVQVEAKPYQTSWQIGDTTRSAETLTIPGSVLDPQEGTVECWARALDLYSRRRDVFTVNKPVGSDDRVILGYKVTDTGLELFWKPANATQYIIRATDLDAVADWVYVGFRYKWNGDGYDLALLYNGQVEATGTATNGQMTNFYQALLGCTDKGSGVFTNYANMLCDDLRISSRARTDEEIADAYSSNAPLPVDSDTTLKLDFNGPDAQRNAKTVVI